jgi:hypothetical protein
MTASADATKIVNKAYQIYLEHGVLDLSPIPRLTLVFDSRASSRTLPDETEAQFSPIRSLCCDLFCKLLPLDQPDALMAVCALSKANDLAMTCARTMQNIGQDMTQNNSQSHTYQRLKETGKNRGLKREAELILLYYVPREPLSRWIPPWAPKQKQSSLAPGFSWSPIMPRPCL